MLPGPTVRSPGENMPELDLVWSSWRSLIDTFGTTSVLRVPGLYRIRRCGRADLDYIGQTGVGLRQRLVMLRGVYADMMPYRDPHTAAPALWALRHATGCDFEVSVAAVEGDTPWRKGLEAVAIACYRQEQGRSPTIEFGRMPRGYRQSSGNNASLGASGKRFRGGPIDGSSMPDDTSIPPAGSLAGNPFGDEWCGHRWNAWVALEPAMLRRSAVTRGLYRIRDRVSLGLVYVGQGAIPGRPLAHLARMRRPDDTVARLLAGAGPLEYSSVANPGWSSRHRLELENDLIAAHVLATGSVPAIQFRG
jgi:hypothetical protein